MLFYYFHTVRNTDICFNSGRGKGCDETRCSKIRRGYSVGKTSAFCMLSLSIIRSGIKYCVFTSFYTDDSCNPIIDVSSLSFLPKIVSKYFFLTLLYSNDILYST